MDPTIITSAILAICFLLIVAMYLLGYEAGRAAANHRASDVNMSVPS
jgi:hypothetical protein